MMISFALLSFFPARVGKTMLYIPMEPIGTAEAAAKQKDLVQRLESTLIHWTRQIKEVLNRQACCSPRFTFTPLSFP